MLPLRPAVPAVLVLALALAGCVIPDGEAAPPQAAAPAAAGPGAAARTTALDIPLGLPCGAELNSFKSVLDNDLRTGHVNKTVYDRAIGDLKPVVAAAEAGRNVEAIALTNATKRRFGYPVPSGGRLPDSARATPAAEPDGHHR